jgi:ribosomal-protein-alanine N-acetyltransferase
MDNAIALSYTVEPMRLSDLEQVMQIERLVFSAPWSERAYRYEVTQNEHSTMVVVRPSQHGAGRPMRFLQRLGFVEPCPVLGYAGCWLLVDEIHISTIAVHPEWRGRGLGELLLVSLLDRGIELEARQATLEVRVSNLTAQALYR